TTPVQVRFQAGTVIKSIGEGRDAGYAVDETGQGWAWGEFTCNSRTPSTFSPVEVPGLSGLVSVSGGGGHVLWLTSSGQIYACGTNSSGQLGDGKTRSTLSPVAVSGLPAGDPAVAISSGSSFSTALLADGEVWAWGKGNRGQLGDGSIGGSDVPQEVKLPAGLDATEVYAGGDVAGDGQAIAVLSNDEVVAWGADNAGQLGDGKRIAEPTPVPVSVPAGVTFSSVATAGLSSYAIDTQGNLWAWGSDAEGQIGNHSRRSVSQPVEVDSGVEMVSSTARDVIDLHG
ncbi:MAG: RCC1 domain-containing protein, partial [Acidimicrobiales bacterium]